MLFETEFRETDFGKIPVVNGRRLASLRSPDKEAVSWCERADYLHSDIIVFGYGAGFHIQELVKRIGNRELLVFDLNEGLDFETCPKNVVLVHTKKELLEKAAQIYSRGFQVLFHQVSVSLAEEEYERALYELCGRKGTGLERALNRISGQTEFRFKSQEPMIDRELVKAFSPDFDSKETNLLYALAEILK